MRALLHGVTRQRIRGRKLQQLRAAWFSQHPLCVKCEERNLVTLAVELDHRIPLHQGGTDEPSNWQGLCKPCHIEKSVTERGMTRRPKVGRDGWPRG